MGCILNFRLGVVITFLYGGFSIPSDGGAKVFYQNGIIERGGLLQRKFGMHPYNEAIAYFLSIL
jgi:hypothetical protein